MSETFIAPKKFELVEDDFIEFSSCALCRIRALMNFGNVKAGELGGYIEKEANLSQFGKAWISGDAQVYEDARVSGNARISGQVSISGRARISGDARVTRDARVTDDARVFGNAYISSYAYISGYAQVFGYTSLSERMRLSGHAWVSRDEDVLWFPNLGREYSALTVYRTQTGIELTHGIYCGTPEALLEKVIKQYGHSRTAREYRKLIEFAQYRLQADDSLKEVAT
ncbi:LptA/OstA family protein [Mycoavidus sp. SF9855]|uniref:LptA/OstA family protein n=1 Tax=Mycoavidus sp. SF9855 TaxID=2968475 RepID=UPI00211BD429|nr:LptA/OstA family protein [Mycoavidus sp. SF9855]UUM20849.1 LptA/OstA family protein [Mycoavidus sp. SF9855]